MQISYVGRLKTGNEDLDLDYRDSTILEIDGTAYLYASTGLNGGLVAWELGAGTSVPILEDSQIFFSWAALHSEGLLLEWSNAGGTYLIYGHAANGGLLSHRIGTDGDIWGPKTYFGFEGLGDDITAITCVDLPGIGDVFYVIDSSGAMLCYEATHTDGAVPVAGDILDANFGRVTQIETVTLGGHSYLLTAEVGTHTIGLYRIDPNTGALTISDQMGAMQGLGIHAPTAFELIVAFEKTWVLVAGSGSGTLSVMEITAAGKLRPTDHLLDTRDTRFDGVVALQVVETQGQVFVVAAGADDGITLFSLLPTGQLVMRAQIVHDWGQGLENITTLSAHVSGSTLQLFAGGGDGGGLSYLTVDLSALGLVMENTQAGSQTLLGTEQNDILIAQGYDVLKGGAGDDLLVARADGADMWGGSGADTFVLAAGANRNVIRDFEIGVDHIDFSMVEGLRDPSQLRWIPTVAGARVFWGSEVLMDIRTTDWVPLYTSDAFGLSFGGPDRALILGTGINFIGSALADTRQGSEEGDKLNGMGGDDFLAGLDGDDFIKGGVGEDTLVGGNGADSLEGGSGHDRLVGGAGNDSIEGGEGRDTLLGGKGHDHLVGGAQADRILGGGGDDHIYGEGDGDYLKGGGGNDRIYGGEGADKIFGGGGVDRLEGGVGNDLLNGGGGNDRLLGQAGDDSLIGRGGADRLVGGGGNDLLKGNGGRDLLKGAGGDDLLNGGGGRDRLKGGAGQDRMLGQAGNDRLIGGGGHDTLEGGRGNDLLKGNFGRDTFVFKPGHGVDVILDFKPNIDTLDLSAMDTGWQDLTLIQIGQDLVIRTDTGQITLEDVQRSALDANDFVF